MNPWNERASMSARTHNARAVRQVSAPPARALETSAHVPDDARALTEDARSSEDTRAHVPVVSAHGVSDLIDAITAYSDAPEQIKEWMRTFVQTNGKLPNRNEVATAAQRSPGHVARWITPVRKALGY
jgi:hypothetical protein